MKKRDYEIKAFSDYFDICAIWMFKTTSRIICGDHICVNKSEAEQYFEDNLSIEVQIVDNKDQNSKI